MQEGRNVLDVYGGRDCVFGRLSKYVCDKLLESPEYIPKIVDRMTAPVVGRLIAGENSPLAYSIFTELEDVLDLSFMEALGDPTWDKSGEAYWMAERVRNPMLMTGVPVGGDGKVDISSRAYFTMRVRAKLGRELLEDVA